MKKVLFLSLSIFLIPLSVNAVVTPNTNVATTSYVDGAYESLDADKQPALVSGNNGNITESGTGPMVTGIAASSGTVTVNKAEVTIPVGSASTPTGRAVMWVQ